MSEYTEQDYKDAAETWQLTNQLAHQLETYFDGHGANICWRAIINLIVLYLEAMETGSARREACINSLPGNGRGLLEVRAIIIPTGRTTKVGNA